MDSLPRLGKWPFMFVAFAAGTFGGLNGGATAAKALVVGATMAVPMGLLFWYAYEGRRDRF